MDNRRQKQQQQQQQYPIADQEDMVTIPASLLNELILNIDRDFLSTFSQNNPWIAPFLQSVNPTFDNYVTDNDIFDSDTTNNYTSNDNTPVDSTTTNNTNIDNTTIGNTTIGNTTIGNTTGTAVPSKDYTTNTKSSNNKINSNMGSTVINGNSSNVRAMGYAIDNIMSNSNKSISINTKINGNNSKSNSNSNSNRFRTRLGTKTNNSNNNTRIGNGVGNGVGNRITRSSVNRSDIGTNNSKTQLSTPVESFHYDSLYVKSGIPLFLEQLNKYFGHLFWDPGFTHMEAYFYRKDNIMYEDDAHIPFILAEYHTYQIETIFTLDLVNNTGEIRRIVNTVTNIQDVSKNYVVTITYNDNDQLASIQSTSQHVDQLITINSNTTATIHDQIKGWQGNYQYSSHNQQPVITSDDPNSDDFSITRGYQFLVYYMVMIN